MSLRSPDGQPWWAVPGEAISENEIAAAPAAPRNDNDRKLPPPILGVRTISLSGLSGRARATEAALETDPARSCRSGPPNRRRVPRCLATPIRTPLADHLVTIALR